MIVNVQKVKTKKQKNKNIRFARNKTSVKRVVRTQWIMEKQKGSGIKSNKTTAGEHVVGYIMAISSTPLALIRSV